MDFAAARDTMIESQVRTNDVSDLALQGAMRVVEREAFVVAEKRAFAYAEVTSPTPSGRWLWKPRDFSKLAQAANVMAGEQVLVIGGAGGYSAAVFAALGCTVTVLDEVAADVPGVTSVVGALEAPPAGPFDLVFVDGGVEAFPDAWTNILAEQGRLCVVVLKGPMGSANIFTKSGTNVAGRVVFDATVPPLPGFSIAPAFAF
jgi:protein-L-isoaspartate(D-aspartate) O-methyltransferase